MPIDLPGIPLQIPDQVLSSLRCPNCKRTIRKTVTQQEENILYQRCPFCGVLISTISNQRLEDARRKYEEKHKDLDSPLEQKRQSILKNLIQFSSEVSLNVFDLPLVLKMYPVLQNSYIEAYEAKTELDLAKAELRLSELQNKLRHYYLAEKDREKARNMAIIVPISVFIFIIALVIWGTFPNGPSSDYIIPIIQVPLPILVWSIVGSILAIPYRFNKSNKMESMDPFRWVYTRPFTGMVMGIIAYFIFKAGFITIAAENNISLTTQSTEFGSTILFWLVAFIGGFSDRLADSLLKLLVGRFGGEAESDVISPDHMQPDSKFHMFLAENFAPAEAPSKEPHPSGISSENEDINSGNKPNSDPEPSHTEAQRG